MAYMKLSRQEVNELVTAWQQQGDTAARDTLVEGHLPLCRKLAGRYNAGRLARGRSDCFDELYSIAMEMLLKAIDKFDVASGNTLGTYLGVCFRGAPARELPKSVGAIYVPGVTKNPEAARKARAPLSLTARDDDGNRREHLDPTTCPDYLGELIDQQERRELQTQVAYLLDSVSPLERDIVKRHILGGETLEDIGKDHHLTRERVRQHCVAALKELRFHASKYQQRQIHASLTHARQRQAQGGQASPSPVSPTQPREPQPMSLLESLENVTVDSLDAEIDKLDQQLRQLNQQFRERIKKLKSIRRALFHHAPASKSPASKPIGRPAAAAPTPNTNIRRVWDYLRQHGEAKTGTIVKALGMDTKIVSLTLTGSKGRWVLRTSRGGWVAISHD